MNKANKGEDGIDWDKANKGEDGTDWEIRTDIYTLPCVKQITNGNLLNSTGSSAPCSMVILRCGMAGWEGGPRWRGCIYTYSLSTSLYSKN